MSSEEDLAHFDQIGVEGLLQVSQTYNIRSAVMARMAEIMHSRTGSAALAFRREKEDLMKKVGRAGP